MDAHQKSRPGGAASDSNNTRPNHITHWSQNDHPSVRAAREAADVAADRVVAAALAIGATDADAQMLRAAAEMVAACRFDLLIARRAAGGG